MDTETLVYRLYTCLNLVLEKINEGKLEGEKRHGGFACVYKSFVPDPRRFEDYQLVFLGLIGTPPEGKWGKYCKLAQEKPSRLSGLPKHLSSWQSRVPSLDWWGGAIRAGEYIISFSGLPELDDEALCLLGAVEMELLSIDKAREIAAISNNVNATALLLSLPACAHC